MSNQRFCDGIRRRDMLRFGAAGAFGMGITLPSLLEHEARLKANGVETKDTSLIIVFLQGGLSTIDTWDMKPEAPAEFRGDFSPISTVLPGVQISEHLPKISKVHDKFSLVRSFGHANSNHGQADHFMLTGYPHGPGFNGGLKPNNQKPCVGAVIGKELGPRGGVPPYVCLPRMHNSAGSSYLGSSATPFVVGADPNAPDFKVPDLAPPVAVQSRRLNDRRALLKTINRYEQSTVIQANQGARAMRTFQEKAFELMTSDATKAAFDINSEPDAVRERYGRNMLGQSCLMARRLIEAGVRCAFVNHIDWDTHYNNFHVLKNELLPKLDAAMSSLLTDLDERGMLDSTMVLVTGEFGRTPRINKDAGRDHWGPSCAIAMAGGGVQGGRVIGASNERAERPATTPYGPADLMATIYHGMGIDPEREFLTPEGRPVPIVPGTGRVISELF
ncbi:MAG: DUF1501 domain-containing protein [Pirellulales bacterium]|nr:DUF1501 domain-containing protein [Pirellulales bacterium]